MSTSRNPLAGTVDPARALLVAHASLPYFLGLFTSWTLHGASVVLLPSYLFQFRRNPLRERLFICALVALNTVDVGFDLSRVIKIYVVHFADPLYLVSPRLNFENQFLYFSPVFIILICQIYLIRKGAIFLRSAGGRAQAWRHLISATLSALIAASAACGYVSQYIFWGYDNYIEAVDEVSKTFKNTYSITHVLWMLFGALGIAGIAGVLTLELAQTRAWQRQTTQTGRDDRNPARADRIYIGLRNCSFLVVISIISFILFLTENKAWTYATGSLLPRLYSISVIVWTALPRPRPSAPSQATSEPPDLSWTLSDLPSAERKDPSSRVWTMFSRSRPGGGGGGSVGGGARRPVSLLRRGRRGQQPKQWVLDLEADDDGRPTEKIDFHIDDGEPLEGPLARLDPHGPTETDQDEAIELKQWRENVRVVGHATRTSFSSASPSGTHAQLNTLRQRSSVSSESRLTPSATGAATTTTTEVAASDKTRSHQLVDPPVDEGRNR